jgi:hypothetical protein
VNAKIAPAARVMRQISGKMRLDRSRSTLDNAL